VFDLPWLWLPPRHGPASPRRVDGEPQAGADHHAERKSAVPPAKGISPARRRLDGSGLSKPDAAVCRDKARSSLGGGHDLYSLAARLCVPGLRPGRLQPPRDRLALVQRH